MFQKIENKKVKGRKLEFEESSTLSECQSCGRKFRARSRHEEFCQKCKAAGEVFHFNPPLAA